MLVYDWPNREILQNEGERNRGIMYNSFMLFKNTIVTILYINCAEVGLELRGWIKL